MFCFVVGGCIYLRQRAGGKVTKMWMREMDDDDDDDAQRKEKTIVRREEGEVYVRMM